MFWSGNFIVVRELKFLLKEENVTLAQVLEADDILQECKADNNALMQFLTRPDILAELITLITEEPPKNVEVSQQYRHASIACEVLTSPLSMLSDRLSLDTAQMNRLCDFINRDPPLNPLLASYFSKTVEMLLERSPKQDWYLYHIVCLRVLDFFKSRRDFLPNLLRHISTSAIADTFKYFIRLDDLFNKCIMEWLEEHQIIECLIQIICGTYGSEEFSPRPEEPEKGQQESSEKEDVNHKDVGDPNNEGSQDEQNNRESASPPELTGGVPGVGAAAGAEAEASAAAAAETRRVQLARAAAVASANAAALLCDLVATGCAVEGAATRSRTAWALSARLGSEQCVSALLQGVFTCGGAARTHALVHAARLLLALLHNPQHHAMAEGGAGGGVGGGGVELATAPHLPLLHHALLHDPARALQEESGRARQGEGVSVGVEGCAGEAVGSARVMTATLLAHLALSEVEEVSTTLLTLGTPGVLVDMFFQFPNNNFLHAAVLLLVRHALANATYRMQYAAHLLVECDLLTRLMDAFEDNENKQEGRVRSGYMGHVILMLSCISTMLEQLSPEDQEALIPVTPSPSPSPSPTLAARWNSFREHTLYPTINQFATPLGGSYPSDNVYELSYAMATASMDEVGDDLTNDNEIGHPGGHADSAEFIADGLGFDEDQKMDSTALSNFMELAAQRFGGDDMWDDAPEGADEGEDEGEEGPAPPEAIREVLGEGSPWDEAPAGGSGGGGGAGWAQFEAAPLDAFSEQFHAGGFPEYWPYAGARSSGVSSTVEEAVNALRLVGEGEGVGAGEGEEEEAARAARTASLAKNVLTALSAMSPAAIANIVNANLAPLSHPRPHLDTDTAPPARAHFHNVNDRSSVGTDGLLAETDGLPVETVGLPLENEGLPIETVGSPAEAVSGSENAVDSRNVPGAFVQISSVDSKVRELLPSESDSLSSLIETKTEVLNAHSEFIGTVENISSMAVERDSNAPASVIDNADRVLNVDETPSEVIDDASER